MSTEETEARLLAEWLAAPAGSPPPEGLSLDAVAAVYALRPDRAPPPRVSIEDILDNVHAGPFAPSPTLGAARRAGPETRRAAPARRRAAWWMAPAVGVTVTAAAAILLVIPLVGHYASPTLTRMAEQAASPAPEAAAPAAPAAAPVAAPSPDASSIPEAEPTEARRDVPVGRVAGAAPTTPMEVGPDAWALAGKGERAREEQALDEGDGLVGPQGGAGLGTGGGGYASGTVGADKKDQDAPGAAPPPPPEPPADAANAAPVIAEAESYPSSGEAKKSPAPAPTTAASAPAKAKSTTTRSAPSQAPASSAPARGYADEADDADSTTLEKSSFFDAAPVPSRSDALPADYDPGVITARADVAAVYAAAEAAAAAGRAAEAVAAYAPLLKDGDARVAEDAAARSGRVSLAAGRAAEALATAKRVLARTTANTAFRSALLVVEGDAYAATGNTGAAAQAYAEAARLNAAR